jgi:ABC-type multidrug transport system fused ATPase/permease subunit
VNLLRNNNKTVLLATHQTLCFPDADALVIIDDGNVLFRGPFTSANGIKELSEILGSSAQARQGHEGENSNDDPTLESKTSTTKKESALQLTTKESKGKLTEKESKGKLTEKEKTATGAVTVDVWMGYVRLVGGFGASTILILAMALNVQQVLVNWWLSVWSSASDDESNTKTTNYYLLIYFLLGLLACLLILSYQLTAATGGLRAAAQIHNQMFKSVLKAPLSYFDTTPSGRLLNLFTADIKLIDESLITQLSGSMSLLFMMLAVLGTIIAAVPFVLAVVVPLFMFYGWIQLIYRNTARELKRFDSATLSPIFNHFAETVNGLSSIRAFRCESRMLLETEARINNNSRYWTKNNWVNRWLGLRLDWIGASLVGTTAVACVLAIKFGYPLDAGLVGLVLSYTTTLTGLLNWGVRRFSEAELGMVAVERTMRLFKCPQEVTRDAITDIPPQWPNAGEVRLTNVSVRYRPGLPKVLTSVNLFIPKHTKVGVCGRTGSGKTTLAKCTFVISPWLA